MMPPERCLRCDWWSFNTNTCDRIFKATIRVAQDAGEIRLETQPGLLPEDMEKEFGAWLVGALGDMIDSWPGWYELKRIRDSGKKCVAEKPNVCIKEYGKTISLVKPLKKQEAQPEKNLDSNGLFKADISLL